MKKTFLSVLLTYFYVFSALPEDLSITPYGMAQFRLRYEHTYEKTDDVSKSASNYSNLIGYKTGLKAQIKDVLLHFEIGNDWGSTEAVSADQYNYLGKRSKLYPYFSLAFVQYNPSFLHIQAGIIPVKGTHLTDILGVSLQSNGKNYKSLSHAPWVANTNGSMQGLRIGAPIKKNGLKIGFDLLTAVISDRKASLSVDNIKNPDGVMVMLEAPVTYNNFTLLPQFIAIPYRYYDANSKNNAHEFMGGLEGNINISKTFSIRFGYGFAIYKNDCIADSLLDLIGMNGGIGSTIAFGPGKLDLDFKLGMEENREVDSSREIYPYIETKYNFIINKNFSITPRVRIFITSTETDKTTVKTRPELIFTGSF